MPNDDDIKKTPKMLDEKAQKLQQAHVSKLTKTTLKAFLENTPPDSQRLINGLVYYSARPVSTVMTMPAIQLYCRSTDCERVGYFDCTDKALRINGDNKHYAVYKCRNCQGSTKTYALSINILKSDGEKVATSGHIVSKYGERPKFGLPEPTALNALIKNEIDKELFIKGFECETDEKGIAAYAYYRRIVDSQKDKLLDRLIEVVEKIHPGDGIVVELKKAKKEQQFSKAINSIKSALPRELMIDGANPLTALYKVLSIGIHNLSDGECLDYAHDIRIVLTKLLDKMNILMDQDDEVKLSMKRLLNIETI